MIAAVAVIVLALLLAAYQSEKAADRRGSDLHQREKLRAKVLEDVNTRH